VFETRSAIHYQNGAAAAALPRAALAGTAVRKADVRPDHQAAGHALDEILAASFPASDPPSWNSGTAYLNPVRGQAEPGRPVDIGTKSRPPALFGQGVITTSRKGSGEMTFVDIVTSFAGATGIVLLVPLAILLIGLPIVLSVRGVVEALAWLFAFISS
jgi:hypothetical protein